MNKKLLLLSLFSVTGLPIVAASIEQDSSLWQDATYISGHDRMDDHDGKHRVIERQKGHKKHEERCSCPRKNEGHHHGEHKHEAKIAYEYRPMCTECNMPKRQRDMSAEEIQQAQDAMNADKSIDTVSQDQQVGSDIGESIIPADRDASSSGDDANI